MLHRNMGYFNCLFHDLHIVNDPIFGQTVEGASIDVGWLTMSTALAYYTIGSFLWMFIFLVIGFWHESLSALNRLRLSLLFWRWGIVCFAFVAMTSGITRFTIVLGVTHNVTEVNQSIALMEDMWPERFKDRRLVRILVHAAACFYLGVEFFCSLSFSLDVGYSILIVMGLLCDITCYALWITFFHFNKPKGIFPLLAFSVHALYIVFFFSNCAWEPWGRVVGLGFNAIAVSLSCVPPDKHHGHIADALKGSSGGTIDVNLPTVHNTSSTDALMAGAAVDKSQSSINISTSSIDKTK